MRYGGLARLRLNSPAYSGSIVYGSKLGSNLHGLRPAVVAAQQRWSSGSALKIPSPSSSLPQRQWSTPLAKTIASVIEVTGPISIAAYMRQCLTSPDGGYYTSPRSSETTADPFGVQGDFITSPEISQIFGELVGLWFMTEWMAQGIPKTGVHFIEFGPGRGTLMSDILRTISQFKAFAGVVEEVWLVEAGSALREKQRDLLCGPGATMAVKQDKSRTWWEANSLHGNTKIKWVEDVVMLPPHQYGLMPFVIAHEFFDALPIHAFESVAPSPQTEKTQLLDKEGSPVVRQSSSSKEPQWRELMVVATQQKLGITTSSNQGARGNAGKDLEPDFRLTLAHASNPMSLVLPEKPRYRPLKATAGSRIEISPDSFKYIGTIADRIGSTSNANSEKPKGGALGAALIVDYGPASTIPINSLRGIRSHKVVSPFTFPGQADLSADVDFTALADAALEASPHVEVHGPIEQGSWLSQMGIQERAQRLLKSMDGAQGSVEEVERRKREFDMGWRRLVEGGPRGMGSSYKVMAILPEGGGKRRPVGFGGGVAG